MPTFTGMAVTALVRPAGEGGTVIAVGDGKLLDSGERAKFQVKKGDDWTDTGLVFTKEDGEAWHPEVVSRFFRQAVKRSLLPEIRLHDLRHTHATLALRAGIQKATSLLPPPSSDPIGAK